MAESTSITSFKDTQLNDDVRAIAAALELIAERLQEVVRGLDNISRNQ